MENVMKKISVLIFVSVIISSCGLSLKSDSSCKSTLCNGYWCGEGGAEPMISKYGTFSFKNDGSCQYATMGGMNGHQVNGTWQLGDAVDDGAMHYRKINVTMSDDIGMGTGNSFEIRLYQDQKNYLSFVTGSAQYFHFDNSDKPL